MIYHDGEWTDDPKEVRSATSMARTRGIGVFNTLRTYKGRVLFLNQQVEKLVEMSSKLGAEVATDELIDLVHQAIKRNPGESDVSVRIIVAPGAGQFLNKPEDGKPIISVMTHEIAPLNGFTAKLKTVSFYRPYAELKHTNYLAAYIAMREAAGAGFYDIIYTDGADDPRLLEASTNNLLFIKGHTIVAPASDIYPGLSRRMILDNAPSVGFDIVERDVHLSETGDFDGAYMSGVTYGPRPVVQIDDKKLDTTRGPTHQKLHQLYLDIVERSVE